MRMELEGEHSALAVRVLSGCDVLWLRVQCAASWLLGQLVGVEA